MVKNGKFHFKGMRTEVVAFAMKKMRKMLKLKTLPQSGWVGAASL